MISAGTEDRAGKDQTMQHCEFLTDLRLLQAEFNLKASIDTSRNQEDSSLQVTTELKDSLDGAQIGSFCLLPSFLRTFFPRT